MKHWLTYSYSFMPKSAQPDFSDDDVNIDAPIILLSLIWGKKYGVSQAHPSQWWGPALFYFEHSKHLAFLCLTHSQTHTHALLAETALQEADLLSWSSAFLGTGSVWRTPAQLATVYQRNDSTSSCHLQHRHHSNIFWKNWFVFRSQTLALRKEWRAEPGHCVGPQSTWHQRSSSARSIFFNLLHAVLPYTISL